MIGRRVFIVAAALLLAVQVIRNAAVNAFAELYPDVAAKLWSGHPQTEISLALTNIGSASRARRPVDAQTFALMNDAAVKSPLSPEPFLVRGVQAQKQGQHDLAANAFAAAQSREPRSLPAAYFLADHYLEAGQIPAALKQMGLLSRLSPNGHLVLAPFVAAFARNPANWPELRSALRAQPPLQTNVLNTLALDPTNAGAILALADEKHRTPDASWLPTLLSKLVERGDYGSARRIWSTVGRGGASGSLVFDTAFANPVPPPPFNWALASSTVGLAERQSDGRLHAIFYGNVDGVLASQLVQLPAGVYRMQLQLVGSPLHAESLRWSVRCVNSSEALGVAGTDEVASRGWTFSVPAGCPAQWLELSGRSADVAQQAEVTIGGFSVTRDRGE